MESVKNEMTKRQMQGCEVLEIDGVIRSGLCSSSAMANIGTASRPPEGGWHHPHAGWVLLRRADERWEGIINDNVYGPYASAVEAELAARECFTLTDFNRAITELERKGRIRRAVDENGVPRYQAVGPSL